MTAIRHNDGTGWRLPASTRFPHEQTFDDLVKETPHILPMAGDPVHLFFRRPGRGDGSAGR
jgi:hypothetical protein